MKKFRFRNFQIYKDAIKYRHQIKSLTDRYFPNQEKFILTNQIIRAANSIILNIAEGTDRTTDKDFANFLNKSHTSLNEVVSCIDIALDDKYIKKNIHRNLLIEAESLANQITAFRRKLLIDNS